MEFFTENSIYHVNVEEKKIRRISGNIKPTDRQGSDGNWKLYEKLTIAINERALIYWGGKSLDGTYPATLTSVVTYLDMTEAEYKLLYK